MVERPSRRLRIPGACPVGVDALATGAGSGGRWWVVTVAQVGVQADVRCWDVDAGPDGGIVFTPDGLVGGVTTVAVTRLGGGREVVLSGGGRLALRRWDQHTGMPLDTA